jgi:hypothetical protein
MAESSTQAVTDRRGAGGKLSIPSGLSFFASATAALLVTNHAGADPQVSVGATVGVAEAGLREAPRSTDFHLGGVADVLLLRNRDSDMAVGPYVGVATEAFDSLTAQAGAEWLVPLVRGDLPFVLSVGALAHRASGFGWEPGVSSRIFFGSRDYNFHSWYGLGAGLFVEGRYGLGDGREADLVFGAQLDLALVAMPFLFLYEAVAR